SGQVCRRLPVFGRACVARPNQARLFGVLGDPVDHSLSPAMHNAAFAAAGLPHVYLRYRVPAALLPDAVRDAKALRMGGLNLTVPLKEIVLPLLDAITHEAERIGAVNTLLFPPGGRTVGDNTDGRGFLAALRGRVRLSGARALVIGAGGSARAVAAARCQPGGARIPIPTRTPSRAARAAAARVPCASARGARPAPWGRRSARAARRGSRSRTAPRRAPSGSRSAWVASGPGRPPPSRSPPSSAARGSRTPPWW